MVEILRPAQRHFQGTAETARLLRVGAPAAPFLTQLLTRGHKIELTNAEGAAHYEAASALSGEQQRSCVATL